jgi:hypothetical protein
MFNKDKKLREKNLLELIPVRCVGHESKEDGTVSLLIPRFKSKFLLNFLPKKKSPFVKINLDKYGTGFWQTLDDKRNVQEIGNMMAEKFGDAIEPVFERLNIFIFQLRRQGFLELKDPNDELK